MSKQKNKLLNVMLLLIVASVLCFCGGCFKDKSVFINVSSISVEENSVSILIGETYTPKVSIYPSYASNKNYNLSYVGENNQIFDIQDKSIIGKSVGSAWLQISSVDMNKTTLISVTVLSKAIQLETPNEINFENNNFIVNANAYTNSYEFGFSYDGEEFKTIDTVGTNKISFEAIFDNEFKVLYNQPLKVRVKAVGNTNAYLDSEYFETEFVFTEPVKDLKINQNSEISFLADAGEYSAKIFSENGNLINNLSLTAVENSQTLTIPDEILKALNSGYYTIVVESLSSLYEHYVIKGESVLSFYVAPKVNNINITNSSMTWEYLDNSFSYLVKIFDAQDILDESDIFSVEPLFVSDNLKSNSVNLDGKLTENRDFIAVVFTISEEKNTFAKYSFSSYNFSKLNDVENLTAEDGFVIWNAVPNTNTYYLNIRSASLQKIVTVSTNRYDFSNLPAGNYTINIKALGGGLLSSNSKAYNITKLPTINRYDIIDEVLTLETNLTDFYIYIYLNDVMDPVKILDNTKEVNLREIIPQGDSNTLKIKIVKSGYISSDYYIIEGVTKPEQVTDLRIENGVLKYNSNLNNSNYNIKIYKNNESENPWSLIENLTLPETNLDLMNVESIVAGHYKVVVKIVSSNNLHIDSENVEIEFDKLETPILQVNNNSLVWSDVANSTGYQIIGIDNQEIITNNNFDCSNILAGEYNVEVVAVGNGTNILNSSYSNTIKVVSIADTKITFNKESVNLVLENVFSKYILSYNISYNIDENNYTLSTINTPTDVENVDISSIFTTAGNYNISISTNLISREIDSMYFINNTTSNIVINKLRSIKDSEISLNENNLIITFEDSSYNNYSILVNVKNKITNQYELSNVILNSVEGMFKLPLNELLADSETAFEFEMKVLGGLDSVDSDLTIKNFYKLGKVLNIYREGNSIYFNAVANAVDYKINLYKDGVKNNELSIDYEEVETNKFRLIVQNSDAENIDLADALVNLNSYEIEIIAVGNSENYFDSVPSDKFKIIKLAETKFTITSNIDSVILTYENVENAVSYEISVIDSNGLDTVLQTDEFYLDLSEYDFSDGIEISIKSIADTSSNYFDSSINLTSTLMNLLNPTLSVKNGNLSWDNPNTIPDVKYQLLIDEKQVNVFDSTTLNYVLDNQYLAGSHTAKIRAVADYSSVILNDNQIVYCTNFTYNNLTATKLENVYNLVRSGQNIIFTRNDNATSYDVYVDGEKVTSYTNNDVEFGQNYIVIRSNDLAIVESLSAGEHTLQVQVIGGNTFISSDISSEFLINKLDINNFDIISNSNGAKLFLQSVENAESYTLSLTGELGVTKNIVVLNNDEIDLSSIIEENKSTLNGNIELQIVCNAETDSYFNSSPTDVVVLKLLGTPIFDDGTNEIPLDYSAGAIMKVINGEFSWKGKENELFVLYISNNSGLNQTIYVNDENQSVAISDGWYSYVLSDKDLYKDSGAYVFAMKSIVEDEIVFNYQTSEEKEIAFNSITSEKQELQKYDIVDMYVNNGNIVFDKVVISGVEAVGYTFFCQESGFTGGSKIDIETQENYISSDMLASSDFSGYVVTVSVQAHSSSSTILNSHFATEQFELLKATTNVQVKNSSLDSKIISWNRVENASGYKVMLFEKINGAYTGNNYETTVNSQDILEVDLEQAIDDFVWNAGIYDVKVYSLGGSEFLNSILCGEFTNLTILRTLEPTDFSTNGSQYISWSQVAGSLNYTVNIYKFNYDILQFELVEGFENAENATNYYDTGKLPAGSYAISVLANGNSSEKVFAGKESQLIEFIKPETVEKAYVENGQIVAVANKISPTLEITLTNGDEKIILKVANNVSYALNEITQNFTKNNQYYFDIDWDEYQRLYKIDWNEIFDDVVEYTYKNASGILNGSNYAISQDYKVSMRLLGNTQYGYVFDDVDVPYLITRALIVSSDSINVDNISYPNKTDENSSDVYVLDAPIINYANDVISWTKEKPNENYNLNYGFYMFKDYFVTLDSADMSMKFTLNPIELVYGSQNQSDEFSVAGLSGSYITLNDIKYLMITDGITEVIYKDVTYTIKENQLYVDYYGVSTLVNTSNFDNIILSIQNSIIDISSSVIDSQFGINYYNYLNETYIEFNYKNVSYYYKGITALSNFYILKFNLSVAGDLTNSYSYYVVKFIDDNQTRFEFSDDLDTKVVLTRFDGSEIYLNYIENIPFTGNNEFIRFVTIEGESIEISATTGATFKFNAVLCGDYLCFLNSKQSNNLVISRFNTTKLVEYSNETVIGLSNDDLLKYKGKLYFELSPHNIIYEIGIIDVNTSLELSKIYIDVNYSNNEYAINSFKYFVKNEYNEYELVETENDFVSVVNFVFADGTTSPSLIFELPNELQSGRYRFSLVLNPSENEQIGQDGTYYIKSEKSILEFKTKLDTITIGISSGLISWEKVTGVDYYEILLNDISKIICVKTGEVTNGITISQNTIICDIASIFENINSSVGVSVKVIGDSLNNTLNSSLSEIKNVVIIPKVSAGSISISGGNIVWSYDEGFLNGVEFSDGSIQYYNNGQVEVIISFTDNLGTNYTITRLLNYTTTKLSLLSDNNQIIVDSGALVTLSSDYKYNLKVRLLGYNISDNYAFLNASYSSNTDIEGNDGFIKLSTPSNISSVSVDESRNGYINWDKVENAISYTLSITNQDKSLSIVVDNITDNFYELNDDRFTGNVNVKIQAFGGNVYLNSTNSQIVNFIKLSNLSSSQDVSVDETGRILNWKEIENALKYQIVLTSNENQTVVSKYTNTNSFNLDDLSQEEQANLVGTIIITIKAIGGEGGYLNGNSSIEFVIEKPESLIEGSVVFDDDLKSFVWDGVDDDSYSYIFTYTVKNQFIAEDISVVEICTYDNNFDTDLGKWIFRPKYVGLLTDIKVQVAKNNGYYSDATLATPNYLAFYLFASGNGSEDNPYIIKNFDYSDGFGGSITVTIEEQLENVKYYPYANFKLEYADAKEQTSGIDFSNVTFIANQETFFGTFDCNNTFIVNYSISNYGEIGLFVLGEGAIIKNLHLVSPIINVDLLNINQVIDIGFISKSIGSNGVINNITLENITIEDARIEVLNISTYNSIFIGGISGRMFDGVNVLNCSVSVTVINKYISSLSATTVYVGGITGHNLGIIDGGLVDFSLNDSRNYTKFVGGVAGYNSSNISNCTTIVKVSFAENNIQTNIDAVSTNAQTAISVENSGTIEYNQNIL